MRSAGLAEKSGTNLCGSERYAAMGSGEFAKPDKAK
jgi:hypothetical protein